MKLEKITLSLLLGMLLVGCDSRIDAVNEQMANIRNQPPLPIEPAPIFSPVPTFNYSAHQLKSPFLPSSLAAELRVMAGKRVYPNLSRQLQPLESYAIESLNMKGSMRSQAGQIVALIQTPDGESRAAGPKAGGLTVLPREPVHRAHRWCAAGRRH